MIGIRIIYPNSLDQSLRQDVVDVCCVWATCSSCVPAQKDIRYGVNIALVKIWTRDKIKPKHVQQELREPALDILWNVYRTLLDYLTFCWNSRQSELLALHVLYKTWN